MYIRYFGATTAGSIRWGNAILNSDSENPILNVKDVDDRGGCPGALDTHRPRLRRRVQASQGRMLRVSLRGAQQPASCLVAPCGCGDGCPLRLRPDRRGHGDGPGGD